MTVSRLYIGGHLQTGFSIIHLSLLKSIAASFGFIRMFGSSHL